MVLRRTEQPPVKRIVGSFLLAGVLGVSILLLTAFVMGNYARGFQMSGPSMEPTMEDGEQFIGYLQSEPEVDGIIVYKVVSGGTAVGRVHGAPGQTVESQQGFMRAKDGSRIEGPTYELADDEYYVRGDNPEMSIPRIVAEDGIIAVAGLRLGQPLF